MGFFDDLLGAVGSAVAGPVGGSLGNLVGGLFGGGGGTPAGQSSQNSFTNGFSNTQNQTNTNSNTNQFGQQTGSTQNQNFSQTLQGPGQFTSNFFQQGLDSLGQIFNSQNLSSFQGPINANINATQIAGNNAATALGDSFLGAGAQTRNLANQTLAGDFLTPESNPFLGNVLQQLAVPITRQFTEEFLPQSNSNAIASGAFGGSRNGITNALGIDRFTENLTDTIGQQLFNNFQLERDRQFQAPGLLQQAFGLEQGAVNTIRDAGQEQRGFEQSEIDEFRTLDQLARTQPFDTINNFFGALGQVGDRSSFTSSFGDQTTNSQNTSTSQSNQQQFSDSFTNSGQQTQSTANLSPAQLAELQSQTAGRDARTAATDAQADAIFQSQPFQNQVVIRNQARTWAQSQPQYDFDLDPEGTTLAYITAIQSTPTPFGIAGVGQPAFGG